MKSDCGRGAAAMLLDRDEVEGVLSGAFYAPEPRPARPRHAARAPEKPDALQGDLHLALHRATSSASTRWSTS